MEMFIPLAAKSLLIAGITLLVLQAMRRRSAADRSFIAHLGLAAIAILPLAWLLLPQLEVATSLIASEPAVHQAAPATPAGTEAAPSAATFRGPAEPAVASAAPVDWGFWAYAAPAALLVLFTLIALLRLVMLKAKANVLVEPKWLSALAHAQRRMGFKHGTALLTSDELRSPISWGLMRPVILLNSEAAEAHDEAEAIIAHELAHVARLDWVKLLLSRVTVALFWFNPLVWLLAREAHQLREEAADDAVLASDIEDTDYARLLVGIARHECRGLLIGAHGVAPGRTSLARRVQRVLDAASQRAPGGWRWTAAAGFFAAGMAVPLAVLHFVPTTPVAAANVKNVGGKVAAKPVEPESAIESVLAESSAATAAAAAAAAGPVIRETIAQAATLESPAGASIATINGKTVVRSPGGGTITIYPPDAKGHRRTVLKNPHGGVITYADASSVPGIRSATAVAAAGAAVAHSRRDGPIDRAVERKAVGATPEYVRSIRSAAPHLNLDHDDIVELAALRVSPAYLRELASSGLANLDADQIVEARALGISGNYIRSMSAAGFGRLSIDDLVELKALGVSPGDVARYRRVAGRMPTVEQIVEMKALGVDPDDLHAGESP